MSKDKKDINPLLFLAERLGETGTEEISEEIIIRGNAKPGSLTKKDIQKAADLTEYEKIVLREHQIPHIKKIKEIFTKHPVAFDMSTMGAGKTYTTSRLAIDMNYENVIIVCPVSVEAKWRSMTKYGVQIKQVLSYQSLRSVKNKIPKHGLLERYDIEDEETEITKTYFASTDYLRQMCKEGMLFVIDEAQHIKNKNDQHSACQEIIKEIIRSAGKSRVLLLSGTPIDKEEQAVNMMQAMWLIKSSRLYTFLREESRLLLYGAKELLDYINTFPENRAPLKEFLKRNQWAPDNVLHNCYLMFQYFVKPVISSAMPSPPLEIDCKNGYYNMVRTEDRKALLKAILELQTTVKYDERKNTVNYKEGGFGSLTRCLKNIETSKLHDMIRVARITLEEDPQCKVALFVNFTDSLYTLEDGLMDYKPLRLEGSVNKDKRQDLINKFQEPNTKRRLLISNLQVASTGIDLDDKHGDFPRYAFASPKYNILELHQLTRRFVRLDSKSIATFRFFYGATGRKEMSILNALSRKSQVMKDTLEGQVSEGIIFPGDYDDEFESED
jgi:SNF2 family DNA or RNA helicase